MADKKNNNFLYYLLIIILIFGGLFFYDIKFRKPKIFEQKLLPLSPIEINFNILENEKIKNLIPLEKPSLPSEKGRENPFLKK